MGREIVVLDGETLGAVNFRELERFGEVEVYPRTSPAETLSRIEGAEIVVTNKVVIDRKLMERTPTLRLIQITATGMNNVDLEAARELGIKVQNVEGYSTESVAQHTFALVLTLLNRIPYLSQFGKERWTDSPIFTHIVEWREIAGKRWGIIGMGKIGRRVAQLASTFGAEVVYYSTSGKNLNAGYPHLPLEELLSTSQIVTIHAPLNPTTYNLLNRSNLSLLQEEAVLVNVGRGGIVSESDLAHLLKNGLKVWVGLDVMEKEPPSPDNPLLNLPQEVAERVVITPHVAWTSREARERLWRGVVEGIARFLGEQG
jgi:glycerate dehydrogenase